MLKNGETAMENNFKGFDKKAVDFLFALRFSNTLENQAKNAADYKKYISLPLNLLYLDLLEVIGQFNMSFETKPVRCISSPYADRRFSPTAPLKEYMYLRFRQAGKSSDMLGLYFDMGYEAYGYGLRIYKASTGGVNKLKEKISANTKLFSSLVDDLKLKGFEISGTGYKRDRFPDIEPCSAKQLLNMKTFSVSKVRAINDNLFSCALKNEIAEAFLDLKDFTQRLAQ